MEWAEWLSIAAEHYGLTGLSVLEYRQHHSEHVILMSDFGRYVLSKVRRNREHPRFHLQFRLLGELEQRVPEVRQAVATTTGQRYVTRPGHWWYMRRFRPTDAVAIWSVSPTLVASAADVLARIHEATVDPWPDRVGITRSHPDRMVPYHRSLAGFVKTLYDVRAGLDLQGVSPGDVQFLDRTVADLEEQAHEVLTTSEKWNLLGLTHRDYRPDNLLVSGGRVVEVIDWDRANRDHQLRDVAYAALQFGRRQYVCTSADLELGRQFIEAYLKARQLQNLDTNLMRWMLHFVVVEKILVTGYPKERIPLLRQLQVTPSIWEQT